MLSFIAIIMVVRSDASSGHCNRHEHFSLSKFETNMLTL